MTEHNRMPDVDPETFGSNEDVDETTSTGGGMEEEGEEESVTTFLPDETAPSSFETLTQQDPLLEKIEMARAVLPSEQVVNQSIQMNGEVPDEENQMMLEQQKNKADPSTADPPVMDQSSESQDLSKGGEHPEEGDLEKEEERGGAFTDYSMMSESTQTATEGSTDSDGNDASSQDHGTNNNGIHDINNAFDDIVDMPMPLPTGLTRQEARRRAQVRPGAQRIGGEMGATAADQQRRPRRQQQAAVEPNTDVEEEVYTHVIDGATLVLPEQETDLVDASVTSNRGAHLDESAEVIDGHILHDRIVEEEPAPNRWFWVVALLVVVGIILFLAIFFTRPDDDSSSPAFTRPSTVGWNATPAEDAPAAIYPPFRDGMPPASIKAIETIGSPIYYGNIWMLNDPNLHTYSDERQLQRFVLAILYYGTDGDNWFHNDGWLDYDVSECDWYFNTVVDELIGMPVCDEDNNLRLFAMADNNLAGTIPDMSAFNAMPHIPHAFALDLANNNLTGPTPILHTGVSVEIISLSNNHFDTISPGMAARGDNVRILNVDNNKLRLMAGGLLWGLFPSLEQVNFTSNQFRGKLHPNIKKCQNLTYLGAGDNFFFGTLPSELGLLTNLKEFDVSGNVELTGSLPSELGLLSSLQHVDIADTLLTGYLPEEFCSGDTQVVDVTANCSMIQCTCD
ncbi:Leucine Rich Repeat [Seminavis robusta]|uniref:Leucine Rich Repeat n=1 Tax=Seminavis robusta TaxID=568900 RepID=A0A9N8DZG8_9STRA|nr:Leucine Rich Repeat [Seminavis robusta]|eukprot:Sro496_g154670.1 Leucine Rich Repeat (679) ;mRNA; r:58893-60929